MPDTPEQNLNTPATILAFDFGTRNIGIAIGQTLTATANPLTVLRAEDGQPNWGELLQHVANWQPDLLIVGLPLNMDGTESDFCQRTRKFARRLRGRCTCKVMMFDERLSTREAKQEGYLQTKRSSSPRQSTRNYRESPIDALAACLILESWLRQPGFAVSP